MALNFPPNPGDQAIYVDPSSGLKYIFNLAIGGWETAIQPPCIITLDGTAPDINLEGFLWYDNLNGLLYIYRNSSWVAVTDNTTGYVRVTVGQTPPSTATQGDLWWDTVSGVLYIYYVDEDSEQWVVSSPSEGPEGTNTSNVYVGSSPPADPLEGDVYFNNVSDVLYVYTDGSWIPTKAATSGVNSLSVVDPIRNIGTPQDPNIAVYDATTDRHGVIRVADQSEVNDPDSHPSQALTPSRLKVGIDNYLPQATETRKGVMEVATAAEVAAGVDDEKAVTPATLSSFVQSNANPAGTVIAFAGSTAPSGYLKCNGEIVQRSTYPDLFAAIGETYSPGDGTSTFGLPDLRGEFVRGWADDKVGVDDGRALGSFQGDQVAQHSHSFPTGDASTSGGLTGGGNRASDAVTANTNDFGGGAETRPRNIALLYCIKH